MKRLIQFLEDFQYGGWYRLKCTFGFHRKASGLKQPAAVRRWLKARGVAFLADSRGFPISTLAAIERAMYGRANRPDWTPPCPRNVNNANYWTAPAPIPVGRLYSASIHFTST